jgi:hypothetical protein
MKSHFLVVHDYGMGGVWGIMRAHSKQDILNKYPMLQIFDERPAWMSEQNYKRIEATNNFDIDTPPHGWLAEMVKEPGKSL